MNREVGNFLASFKFANSTKDSYRRILEPLVGLPKLDQMDAAGLIEFINKPGWGNSQQNVALFCIQKYFRWRFGDHHPALSATIPRIEPKPRRVLSEEQALSLLASFDTYRSEGARGLAIIAFGLDTGFRRAELCSVQLADVDFWSNTAVALCKGNQWGYGAFSPDTAAILQRWLAFRKPADGVGNLFVSLKTGKGLTGNGMECFFKRLSKSIGFPISPHDLRSSHATLAAMFGASDYAGMLGGRWKTSKQYHHYIGSLKLNVIRPHLPMANLTKFRADRA